MKASLLWCVAFASVLHAAEPPVRDGLVLWLDAAAQGAARQAASLPPIRSQQPVDILLDSSGHTRQAVQPAADRRPLYVTDGEAAFLKFDGKDDFLAITGPRQLAPAVTVFVLAAPKANAGNFMALFGAAEAGKNDYTSGLNFDFGPAKTDDLSVLNVETGGGTGFRDLLVPGVSNAAERPFGDFHVFTVRSRIAKNGTEVFLDGFKGGERDRLESNIGLDQMVVGGRLYSNDPVQPPYAQGSFDGAIAEVLVYDRALTDSERQAVEQSLLAKTVALHGLLSGAHGHALETVKDPPVVQMLLPGFTVRELPLKIGNLNNVRYRYDGKLVALGYDGRIHLLTDTDGDGLEDHDELFWDQHTMRGPIGMVLTGRNDPRGDGVFVASKGKISLFLDQNHDGRAEDEKVVATGWKESFHSVDTLGLALDPKDGSLYFGIGTGNFADPYMLDKVTGRPGYRLDDTFGTIQRLSPDFTRRETVCTGVRFTCALAFNENGDLFATEQEGATWLPNGNPLDELLHIEPGKHYGFPPRHPKYLPNVRDEPAVMEFPPQHQSTVGLVFNVGVNGGARFGPASWAGDAIVCGESRGKLWHTKLVKTPLGYVGQNHLFACLNLLTIDACVSPQGDLVVACHGGPPDWGTGPAGEGRIFKIQYTGRSLPQPVQAWAAAPDEFRIAFDRPLDPADWVAAREKVKIEAGTYVSAGDAFETVRPGYQVVRDQMAVPRRWVEVLGLTLTEDRRTMVLRVPRQTEAVNYAVSLPLPTMWRQPGGVPQHPEMDVQISLHGLSATVEAAGKQLRTVLPHASLAASAKLTAGSAEHEQFFQLASTPGSHVTLQGIVDVGNPFVPAVQLGGKLDWDVTKDPVASVAFAAFRDDGGERPAEVNGSPSERWRALAPIEVKNPASSANGLFLANGDARHSLSTARLYVPWATDKPLELKSGAPTVRTDVRGNWLRGRRLFFGAAGCAACHTLRGEGLAFGPDLSNLTFRDRDSVWHDIAQPSATINPDQAGTLVKFADGSSASGIIRTLNKEKLVLALPGGIPAEFPRNKVASTEPLKTSLMPEGFADRLTPAQREDLLTFLLINLIEPAVITRTDPPMPPARRVAEVVPLIGAAPAAPGPLRILLCAGPKDHGPDEHDYPLWLQRWSRLLALGENVTVATATGFPTVEQLAAADVTVFFNANPEWDARRAALLDEYHRRGGGAVYLHYAIAGGSLPDAVAERMGLTFIAGSKFRHGEFDLVFQDRDHPITRGLPNLHFTDETYWTMRGDVSRLHLLGTAVEDGQPQPELWTLLREKSRIVGCVPGHYTWTFDDPLYRVMVLRSICWAARQENVDRLSELSLVGARMAP